MTPPFDPFDYLGNSPMGLLMKGYLWTLENPNASLLIASAYAAALTLTFYHLLKNEHGIDRATWLIACLGIPLFGLIFYWKLRNPNEFDTTHTNSRTMPPAPRRPETRDIADAVNANIEEMLRKRRAEK